MVTKFLYMTSAFLICFSTQSMSSSDTTDPLLTPEKPLSNKKLNLIKAQAAQDITEAPHASKKPLAGVAKFTKGVLGKGHDILEKGTDGAAQFTVNHLLTEKAKDRVINGGTEKRLHNITKAEKRATQGAQVIFAGGAVGTLLLGHPELAGILGIGAGAAGALTITSNAQEILGKKWIKKLQKSLNNGDHATAQQMIEEAQANNLITLQPVSDQTRIDQPVGSQPLTESNAFSMSEVTDTLSNIIETVSPIIETVVEKVEDRLPDGSPLETVLEKVSPVLHTIEDFVEKKEDSTPSTV